MFWSGAEFEEKALSVRGEKFKDASVLCHIVSEIEANDLKRWLKKSRRIQWDYKKTVKRKGRFNKPLKVKKSPLEFRQSFN